MRRLKELRREDDGVFMVGFRPYRVQVAVQIGRNSVEAFGEEEKWSQWAKGHRIREVELTQATN